MLLLSCPFVAVLHGEEEVDEVRFESFVFVDVDAGRDECPGVVDVLIPLDAFVGVGFHVSQVSVRGARMNPLAILLFSSSLPMITGWSLVQIMWIDGSPS